MRYGFTLDKQILAFYQGIVKNWRNAKGFLHMQKKALVDACLKKEMDGQSQNYAIYVDRRIGLDAQGNWCGHDPDAPRFFTKPEAHKDRPKVIAWAMDAWKRFYTSPASYFNQLRFNRKSTRQQRSESREAVASIAQVLLHYTELASLRVGVPHVTNGFRSLTIEFLAEKAGLGLKRALRAIELLKRAGYLKMTERFDVKDGASGEEPKFIGLAAVKCLTLGFFKSCGINLQWLSAQRRLARKRINRRLNQHVQELQESAGTIDIGSRYAHVGNSRAHVDIMKNLLKADEDKQVKRRERERERHRSLDRARHED